MLNIDVGRVASFSAQNDTKLETRTGGQCQVHHQHCPPMPLPSDKDLLQIFALNSTLETPHLQTYFSCKEGEGQARLDIYIPGFVCKNFSQENNVRFQHSDVRELFISANIETEAWPLNE